MPFLIQIMQSPRFMVLVLGGFMISVMASPTFPFVNGPLAMILILSITLCLLAISMGYYESRFTIYRTNTTKSRYKTVEYLLIFAPGFSLSILLLIRLFSRDHFFTMPALLEFGPKKGDFETYVSNISFLGGGFSSVGHFIQGFFASFLSRVKCWYCNCGYQRCEDENSYNSSANTHSNTNTNTNTHSDADHRATVASGADNSNNNNDDDDYHRYWAPEFRCGATPPDMSVVNIAAYCFTIYPVYNFVKRCIRNAETFATSSYMNNGMEWALGFWTGHSAGFIADTLWYKKLQKEERRRRQRRRRQRASGGRSGVSNNNNSNNHDNHEDDHSSTADTVSVTSQLTPSQNYDDYDEAALPSSIGTTTISMSMSNSATAADSGNDNDAATTKRTCRCPSCSALFVLLMLGWTLGICFLVSVFGACAMTGYTWNSCEGDSEDCVNYQPDGAPVVIAVVLALIPTLSVCAVLF